MNAQLFRAERNEAAEVMVLGSVIFTKQVGVDARHHMLERLSSIIAKELLNGKKVII